MEEEEVANKPIRNIFKMSRVLVNSKDQFKKDNKTIKKSDKLKKINNADANAVTGGEQHETSELENNYSVSSESDDNDE